MLWRNVFSITVVKRGEEIVQKQVSGSRLVQRWTEIARSRGPQEVGRESAKPGLRLVNLQTLLA